MHPPMHPSPPPPLTDQEGAINMLILLHSQKWLPKQVNVAEPASRHYGPKISPKNNLCPTHSLKKKMARASAAGNVWVHGCSEHIFSHLWPIKTSHFFPRSCSWPATSIIWQGTLSAELYRWCTILKACESHYLRRYNWWGPCVSTKWKILSHLDLPATTHN